MIILFCQDGHYRDAQKRLYHCTYERVFADSALPELVNHVKVAGLGGFHCPSCKKFPLKTRRIGVPERQYSRMLDQLKT